MSSRTCLGCVAVIAASACAAGEGSALGTAAEGEGVSHWRVFNVADTNGDTLGDILWSNTEANRLEVVLMDGARPLAAGPEIPGPPGSGWTAVTAADFNRDNLNDVIWTHAGAGQMAVWLLDGARLLAPGPEIPGPPGEGWQVANASDTNGDGMADAVWYNATTHRAAVALMNGAGLLSFGPNIPTPPGDGWAVTNVADTNRDNLADVIWSHPGTNRMMVWLMNGAQLLAPGPEIPGPPGEGWTAVTAADFNRDGMSDVIWTNAGAGRMAVWLLDGARLLAAGPEIPGPPGDGWQIAYAGDTNGDGMADAVWQKAGTSLFAVWLMNGAELLAPGPVLEGPGAVGP